MENKLDYFGSIIVYVNFMIIIILFYMFIRFYIRYMNYLKIKTRYSMRKLKDLEKLNE